MAPGAWRPLLTGELAARARNTAIAIAEATVDLYPPKAPRQGSREGLTLPSLASGTPGMALLFAYLSRGAGARSERYAELAELYMDEAVRTLALMPMRVGLFSGFTGVAWASEHLRRLFGSGAEPGDPGVDPLDPINPIDLNEEIDRALLETLAQAAWQGHFDLGTGITGIGVYALERLPRRTAVRILSAVVGHLATAAIVDGQGITWHTGRELLPAHRRDDEPLGVFDLGVPHGVPGVITLLAEACRIEECAGRARPLLDGAVRWLLSLPRAGQAGFRLGQWVRPGTGGVVPARRLAWCYGDPGAAATLLHAARAVGEERWEREALEIAALAAEAPIEGSGVVDAGLCHGAVGLAHLFNRIYQATDQELFARAAELWYRHGLDMQQPGTGIAGFGSWGDASSSAPEGMVDPGLFTGAAGVGLGLLAATAELEPEWDRLLRVAIPPAVRPKPAAGALSAGAGYSKITS